MKQAFAALVVFGLLCPAAQGQFLAPAFFTLAPTSAIGTVTNNLTITNFPTHFTVTGQVIVNVPSGVQNGILMSWEIRRPLDPNWGTGTLYTGTQLIGYSLPPAGGFFNNTFGQVTTEATSNPGYFPGGSASFAPMSLNAGVANWANIYGSFPFTYVSGGTEFVVQRFLLDGWQTSGPGGNWVIDVPLSSYLTSEPVPEPSTWILGLCGLAGIVSWKQKTKRRLKERNPTD